MACVASEKARWGKDGGLGGRKPPEAVPVATKEATGIDSRDEGVSFPPEERFSVNRL